MLTATTSSPLQVLYRILSPCPNMTTFFASASHKLLNGRPPFSLADLPASRDDSLWGDLRNEYGLSLGELSSLKNYASQQPQQQPAFLVGAVVRGAKPATSGDPVSPG